MDQGPWNKTSIEEFKFFCCSKCDFVTRDDSQYQEHIRECHSEEDKAFFDGSSDAAQMKHEVKIEPNNETGKDYSIALDFIQVVKKIGHPSCPINLF